MSPIDTILLVLLGAILALIGYRIVRLLASLLFGGLLGIVGFQLVLGSLGSITIAFVMGILLFFLGAIAGFIAFKIGLSLVGGYVLASMITDLLPTINITVPSKYSDIVLLVLLIVLAVIIYAILDHVIAIGLAVIGGLLVFVGLTYWLPIRISALIALALAIAGAVYQLKHIKEEYE